MPAIGGRWGVVIPREVVDRIGWTVAHSVLSEGAPSDVETEGRRLGR